MAVQASSQERDMARIMDLANLQQALAVCYSANSKYPSKLEEITEGKCEGMSIPKLPVDPETTQPYSYSTNAGKSRYWLKAKLSSGQECITTEISSARGCSALLSEKQSSGTSSGALNPNLILPPNTSN